jgi:hypothetical protein
MSSWQSAYVEMVGGRIQYGAGFRHQSIHFIVAESHGACFLLKTKSTWFVATNFLQIIVPNQAAGIDQ